MTLRSDDLLEDKVARFFTFGEDTFVFFNGKRYVFGRKNIDESKKSAYFNNVDKIDCGTLPNRDYIPEGFKFENHL